MKEQSTRPGASRSMFLQRGDCGGSGGGSSHLRTGLSRIYREFTVKTAPNGVSGGRLARECGAFPGDEAKSAQFHNRDLLSSH